MTQDDEQQVQEQIPATEFPSLDLAYEFVRPAYDYARQRAEAVEARARATMGFSGTVMFAAPAFVVAWVGADKRSYASPWFIVAALAFACIIGCLTAQQVPRVVGELQVLSLQRFVDFDIQDQQPTFKFNILHDAAVGQELNRVYVNKLTVLAVAAAVLFGAQLLTLAVWVIHG